MEEFMEEWDLFRGTPHKDGFITKPFLHFPIDTTVDSIYHWFEGRYNMKLGGSLFEADWYVDKSDSWK